jgi:hypothetical protein
MIFMEIAIALWAGIVGGMLGIACFWLLRWVWWRVRR